MKGFAQGIGKTLLVGSIFAGAAGCMSGADSTTADPPPAPSGKAYYLPAGTGPALWGPGDLYTFLATAEQTNGAYFQFEAVVPPGGGPPDHIHLREDESFYLVKGTLEMRLGDKTIAVKAGDFVNVPKGTAHSFKNVGTEPATMLLTCVPAGLEKYFEEVFPKADRTKTPPPVTDALIERMKAAAAKHHLEFVPPAQTSTP